MRALTDQLPGLKRRELQSCALCDKGVGHGNYPLFWRLQMERFAIDVSSVRRQHGLELMLGSPALAQAMGPDADLAKAVYGPHKVLVCESCVLSHLPGLFVIAEAERTDLRREHLENERNDLLNSFGNGPFRDGQTRDRLQGVEAELRELGVDLADDEAGMAWWNGLPDDARTEWATKAGNTGRAKDAWEKFKREQGAAAS